MADSTTDRIVFERTLQDAVAPWGLALRAEDIGAMWRHLDLLRTANAAVNLTRITGAADAALRHYADSLAFVAWARERPDVRRVIDVGTGGGFPAVPLAIMRPDIEVVALDGTAKKIRCVAEFATALGLDNLGARPERAERVDIEPADAVVFRAVGSVAACLRWARRLCRRGGVVACFKRAPLPAEENREAAGAAPKLGFRALAPWPYQLGCAEAVRLCQLSLFESTA